MSHSNFDALNKTEIDDFINFAWLSIQNSGTIRNNVWISKMEMASIQPVSYENRLSEQSTLLFT